MNLFENLKQFKTIQPDPSYSETSKRAILAQGDLASVWSAKRTIFRIFETGIAVALTGFFIFLLTGAFPSSKLAPVQFSAIDPQSLHAEAQAIDMQIELANVSYQEGTSESTKQSALPPAAAAAVALSTSTASTTPAVPNASSTASSTTTSTLTIDQALQTLSQ